MAQKRKAREAFSRSEGETTSSPRVKTSTSHKTSTSTPVSAFAAARQARERQKQTADVQTEVVEEIETIVQPNSNQFDALLAVKAAKADISASLPRSPAWQSDDDGRALSSVSQDRINTIESRDAIKSVQVDLNVDEFITFIGEYDLKVISGAVTVYGAVLHQQSGTRRITAFSTHALPQIIARKSSTVIQIKSAEHTITNLAAHSQLFRNISTSDNATSFEYIRSSEEDGLRRNLSLLEVTPDTRKALSQFALRVESERGRNTIMAVGTKSSGKSTFNRQLCNTILTRTPAKRCYFIDLDPGQPEFGPPGQVYLVEVSSPILGPAYSHYATSDSSDYRLIAAHSIAATTFKDDPGYYTACTEALFRHPELFAAVSQDWCPVIVNSCGWVNGLGARVLKDIFDIGVTDAAILGSIDSDLEQQVRCKTQPCYVLDRPISRFIQRSPAELRQIQTMAYFHSDGDNEISITNVRPWIIPYAGSQHSIKAIVSYNQAVDEEFLAEVLDGSIVAVISSSFDDYNKAKDNQYSRRLLRTPEDLPLQAGTRPLDPYRYQYEGLALVRNIDAEQKQLHLVTPISDTRMVELRDMNIVLVRGAFDSPDWAYLADLNVVSGADIQRPWVAKRDMIGIEGAVWRLRHPPSANKVALNR